MGIMDEINKQKIGKLTDIRYHETVKRAVEQYNEGAITARELSNKVEALTRELERVWPSDLKEGELIRIWPVQNPDGTQEMSFFVEHGELQAFIHDRQETDKGKGVNIYGDMTTLDSVFGHQLLQGAILLEVKVEAAQ